MNKNVLLIVLLLLIDFTSQAQDMSRVDSMFLTKIPYDSMTAQTDIKNGIVRVIDIFSPTWSLVGTKLDELITPNQLEEIQRKLGFKSELIIIDNVPTKYIRQREVAYNRVVFKYLDSVNGFDSRTEYTKLIMNAYKHNRDHCGSLLAEIELVSNSISVQDKFVDKHRKIGDIKDSKHPVEIRYYYTPSLVNGGSVTIIQCVERTFTAKKIDYWFNPNKSLDKRKVNRVAITELTPKNSWESFLDSLNRMNFFDFPTMDQIRPQMKKYIKLADGRIVEKRSMITDGTDYTYQVKIDDSIRTFSYHSPMSWYHVYDQVEALKIAGDIKNHFSTNLKPK